MNIVKYSPGPWNYSGHGDHCDVGCEYNEITDADGFEVANQNGILTEANAVLIAAAPELLEALINLTTTARTFRNVPPDEQMWTSLDDEALDAAFEAIAKATGEES